MNGLPNMDRAYMADRPSGDFGRTLREARERRGVSLRQIANATKIGIRALEALERNDISRLPGGIFSRAFVRSYASEVGLDPETTIQEFIAQFPHDSVTAGHPTSTQAEDHEAVESDRRTATTFVRLVALSIPIAAAVIYFSTAGRRAPAALDRPPVVGPSGPVVAPPAPPLPPAAAAGTPSAPQASDRLTVSFSAIRECWVSVTVDGEKTLERLLQAGERQTVEVRKELVFTAGDASAIVLTINGGEVRPLGQSGQVVTARLSPANFREYLANP